jgi:dTDP-4-amino-4,6-dideoxygalactose transaminase
MGLERKKRIKLIEPVVGEEELALIKEVIESGFMTEGPKTHEFEDKVAKYVGARHAIATTSCSTALQVCIDVMKVGKKDEVIVPDFTYPVTADVARLVGASPVLVDVDKDSYNIDPSEVEKAITPNTRGIIPVSLFGNPLDMRPLFELKEEHDLFIVEDAACSLGARFGNLRTGSAADMTCFSFHPRKVITTGEGGMITTDDDECADRARKSKKFGMDVVEGRWVFAKPGTNYKLSDILGAMGSVQMDKIDDIIERRRESAKNYDRLLEGEDRIISPTASENARHIYQTYACYVVPNGARDRLMSDLKESNIESQIGTYSLSVQPSFRDVKRIGGLEVSKSLFENLLALPMAHSMTNDDQRYVVDEITRLLDIYAKEG